MRCVGDQTNDSTDFGSISFHAFTIHHFHANERVESVYLLWSARTTIELNYLSRTLNKQ